MTNEVVTTVKNKNILIDQWCHYVTIVPMQKQGGAGCAVNTVQNSYSGIVCMGRVLRVGCRLVVAWTGWPSASGFDSRPPSSVMGVMMICAWVLPRTTPNTGIARLDRFLVRNFSLRGLYRVGYVACLVRKDVAKTLATLLPSVVIPKAS